MRVRALDVPAAQLNVGPCGLTARGQGVETLLLEPRGLEHHLATISALLRNRRGPVLHRAGTAGNWQAKFGRGSHNTTEASRSLSLAVDYVVERVR